MAEEVMEDYIIRTIENYFWKQKEGSLARGYGMQCVDEIKRLNEVVDRLYKRAEDLQRGLTVLQAPVKVYEPV